MTKPKTLKPQPTTTQQLSSIIKTCRDIMRKDKGLNGDLDRLPQLTWMMFLKFIDDAEKMTEDEATMGGKPFNPTIESPYRWRDWASAADGITGDQLIAFVNNDEAIDPTGKHRSGLLAYLRSLHGNGTERKDVVSRVFHGVMNRMLNGYLMRDVVNKLEQIQFTSSEEIHTLGYLYEAMLNELRDAAGDSGEFYTPRAVVRFMTKMVDPKLGETVLDPACGTGGFLVAAFLHMKEQCKSAEDMDSLQRRSIRGGEAKSLPYLLCQMNLLLHGMEYPDIDFGNSLRYRLTDIGDKERVDVILTNPPFGGEEERSILSNFPKDRQTNETALLFTQLIMRKLRRQSTKHRGGRCAMVVPDGFLFGSGTAARIKEDLLKEFNLHTIVRLPNGVFAPYTSIQTNLLFFDHGGPTKEIWFYELPLPEGKKQYTKTNPLRFDEFQPTSQWWTNRTVNDHAWKVTTEELIKADYNLDVKNPISAKEERTRPPKEIIQDMREDMRVINKLLNTLQSETDDKSNDFKS